jgi:hypothetical protein
LYRATATAAEMAAPFPEIMDHIWGQLLFYVNLLFNFELISMAVLQAI